MKKIRKYYADGLTVDYKNDEYKRLMDIRTSRDFPANRFPKESKRLLTPEQEIMRNICIELWGDYT